MVKDKANEAAFKYLINLKKKHSKMDNLNYRKLEIQLYLTSSSNIYPKVANEIFKWRTRMAKFKSNFKNGSDNVQCPLGCQHDDTQENVLKCEVIKLHLPAIEKSNCMYKDIFSKDLKKVNNIINLLTKALKIRENILEIRNGQIFNPYSMTTIT